MPLGTQSPEYLLVSVVHFPYSYSFLYSIPVYSNPLSATLDQLCTSDLLCYCAYVAAWMVVCTICQQRAFYTLCFLHLVGM